MRLSGVLTSDFCRFSGDSPSIKLTSSGAHLIGDASVPVGLGRILSLCGTAEEKEGQFKVKVGMMFLRAHGSAVSGIDGWEHLGQK